jgi:RNA polymerase II subunit A small phosphatase-like protein
MANNTALSSFVTQVQNPNEQEEDDPFGVNRIDVNAISTATGENRQPLSPRSQNGFCAFFCCASHAEEDDKFDQSSQLKSKWKQPIKPIKIQVPPRSADPGVNSPRPGSNDPTGTAPWRDDHLLPPQREDKKGRKCLVLDLDETLVHSSFKPVECDFIVPVEIENQIHKVYVAKRPFVDEFMKRCGELYEVVVFTASLAKYADPVLDLLDVHRVVDWRLFRESCSPYKGSYVKDMGRMGRDINSIMIIDNSPHSFLFNPQNAIPCESWFSDKSDRELLDLIPQLEQLADPKVTDVKVKLKELGISGVTALTREMAGFKQDSEGSSFEDESYSGSEENQEEDN